MVAQQAELLVLGFGFGRSLGRALCLLLRSFRAEALELLFFGALGVEDEEAIDDGVFKGCRPDPDVIRASKSEKIRDLMGRVLRRLAGNQVD